MRKAMIAAMLVAGLAGAGAVSAQDATTIVQVPAFALPASNQLSPEAKIVLQRMKAAAPVDLKNEIVAQRAFFKTYNDDRLAEMQRLFKTKIEHTTIGGVTVDIVTPAEGVAPGNAARVLLNAHGGAFLWGSGSGALVEAIPIAAKGRIKVIAVDYRLAPEHHYPAASEDMAAVYREVLKSYRPENIGLYGCSAGGVIVAQSVSWFRKERLPRPGAVGTFCGTGAPFSGDSPYLAGPTTSGAAAPKGPLPDVLARGYMTGVAASDTVAYPLTSDAETAAFPPTLMIAGGRDYTASALTLAHRRLARAGVPSQLFLFDGLPHAFFVWPDMPESIEVYDIVARFFDRHLGRKAK